MYHAVVLLGARPALVATQPLEAPRRARRRQLADERRERAPRGDREDDKRLKRVDSLDIVCAVGRERTAHVPLKLTEDGPAVDHRGEIPLARTKAGFVEILPDASPRQFSKCASPWIACCGSAGGIMRLAASRRIAPASPPMRSATRSASGRGSKLRKDPR